MNKTIDILNELIRKGEEFNYYNFCSSRGEYGYPESYSEEWIIWLSRTETFINAKFGEVSVPAKTLKSGLGYRLLGNGEDKFTNAKTLILSALKSAKLSIKDDVLPEVGKVEVNEEGVPRSNKVFIVHGHDEKAKQELELFLTELGLDPVVLHRQADQGQTIIEKFERHSDVGYAFIMMTPDEMAYLSSERDMPESERTIELRARPNVIFEFGFFVGKLGRARVCCLYTGSVSLPSDLGGLVYKQYANSIEESGYSIIKELKAAGYNVQV